MKQLKELLNFNVEYEVPKDNSYGSLENGSWIGLIGQLDRKEVDIAVAILTITEFLILILLTMISQFVFIQKFQVKESGS